MYPWVSSDAPNEGAIAVTGWGLQKKMLLEVSIPAVSVEKCHQLYSNSQYHIIDVMLCAERVGAGSNDACQ